MRKYHFERLKDKQSGILSFVEYRKGGFKLVYGLMVAFLLICLFLSLFPLFFLAVQSFKSVEEITSLEFHFFPKNFDLGKIAEVWNSVNLSIYFLNSLLIVVLSVVAAVIFNGLLAYGVSIVKPTGSKIVYLMVLGSYMIPTVLSSIPLFAMLASLKLTSGLWPYAILPLTFGANAFYFINFKNYFDKIPRELVEAMRVDGAGEFTIFFRLVVPLAAPIVGIVAIFAVSASWSDYLLPSLLLTQDSMQTIMVKLVSLQTSRPAGFTDDMMLMCLLLSILPQIVLFLVFEKQITAGGTDGAVKG